MKFFAILLLLTALLGSNVSAQKDNDVSAQTEAFVDQALYYFHQGNYPLAIQLYKKQVAKTHDVNPMEMLALCYTRTDSVEQAKRILEEAINKTPLEYDQLSCCWTLADIYFKEKNYKQALQLYDLHETKWQGVLRPGDANILSQHLILGVARSKCFEGLHQTDSAVNVLTPYVFCTYKDLAPVWFYHPKDAAQLKDSLKQDSICARYLTLLQQLHSNNSIKAELKKADSGFYYTETLTYERDSTVLSKDFTCGFTFFNTNIIYMQSGEGDVTKKLLAETQTPFYTKAYQLAHFRELPLCRLINALPDKD